MKKRLLIKYNNVLSACEKFLESTGDNLLLASIRQGLTMMIPIALLGSFALLLISFPIPEYQSLMLSLFGTQWNNIFTYIHDGTIGILSLTMVICISYSYIAELEARNKVGVSPIIASCVSLCSFISFFGITKEGFSITNYSVMGAFSAILIAVTASPLFYKLSSIKILRIRPFSDGDSVTFGNAVSALIPATITIFIYAAADQILSAVFGIADINTFLSGEFSTLNTKISNPFLGGLLFIFLIHLAWFFGVHGSNMLETVAQQIYVPALTVNQQLIAAGKAPTQIFTKTFFDTFVLMGGCGSSLCLLIAIFILGKNKNQLRIARFSLFPILFNINELIVFGFPIVLNPIYMIPFIAVPLISTMTSFAAMSLGLVPYTCHAVEWTTPVFISGYYSTGSINGCLLQLFNLIIGTLCYIPFVRLSQTISSSRMKKAFWKLCSEFEKSKISNRTYFLLDRQDSIGSLARAIADDLKNQIQNKTITLFYQPQVNYSRTVFCAEALLRWKHPVFGFMDPSLVIELAEEYHSIDELGLLIIEQACDTIRKMHALGIDDIAISVNVTASQLENEEFPTQLKHILNEYSVNPSSLKIEITEQVALESNKKIKDALIAINNMGIELEMDDFGMGHSSLMYLKEYKFDTIKLDGSLVREICISSTCQDIISSIVYLSRSLNYSVLAEYVESEEQKEILHNLGCNQYQGYLYSKALPFNELIEYIQQSCHPVCKQAEPLIH